MGPIRFKEDLFATLQRSESKKHINRLYVLHLLILVASAVGRKWKRRKREGGGGGGGEGGGEGGEEGGHKKG